LSGVVHCLNGNLLRALIGFGLLDDPRVQASLEYQTASILGDGRVTFNNSATRPGGLQMCDELRRSVRMGSRQGAAGPVSGSGG